MTERTIEANPAVGPRIVISVWHSLSGLDTCVGNVIKVQGISGNDAPRMALINEGTLDVQVVQQTPVWRRGTGEARDVSQVIAAASRLAALWDLPVVSNDVYLIGLNY